MQAIETLSELAALVAAEAATVVYFSRPGCGVCSALRPKVRALLDHFPQIRGVSVDLEALPNAAGEYSIFTIPAVVLFVDGKESWREARYFSMDEFTARLTRVYALRFDQEFDQELDQGFVQGAE